MPKTTSPSSNLVVVSPIMDPEPNYLKNVDFWKDVQGSLGAHWTVHLVAPKPTRVEVLGVEAAKLPCGVRMHRFRTVKRRPRTPFGVVAEYFWHFVGSVSRGGRLASVDAIYAYQGNPSTTFAAAVLAKVHRCRLYVDVQDPWPQALRSAPGVSKWLERPMGFLFEILLGSVDCFIAPDQFAKERITQVHPEVPVCVVRNWSSADVGLAHLRRSGPVEFVYAGRLGPLQPVEMLVRSFRMSEELADANLTIYGSGPDEDKVRLACGDNVRFGGHLGQEELGKVLSQSHFGLLPLAEGAVLAGFNPQKLALYYSYGVIPVAPQGGAVGQTMAEAESGIPVEGQGSEAWLAAMCCAFELKDAERQHMSGRALDFARVHCSRSKAVAQVADIVGLTQ